MPDSSESQLYQNMLDKVVIKEGFLELTYNQEIIGRFEAQFQEQRAQFLEPLKSVMKTYRRSLRRSRKTFDEETMRLVKKEVAKLTQEICHRAQKEYSERFSEITVVSLVGQCLKIRLPRANALTRGIRQYGEHEFVREQKARFARYLRQQLGIGRNNELSIDIAAILDADKTTGDGVPDDKDYLLRFEQGLPKFFKLMAESILTKARNIAATPRRSAQSKMAVLPREKGLDDTQALQMRLEQRTAVADKWQAEVWSDDSDVWKTLCADIAPKAPGYPKKN